MGIEPYQQLESVWATWNNLDPAGMVVCASGTAALHLALEALQLPQGSEVIVPDFGMIACARAVTLAGLTPVFVDCDERLLMDQDLWPHATTCAEAIMVVHIYGRSFDVDQIHQFYLPEPAPSPKVIEDLAEAHGVKPHQQTDAACWSFYRNKIIAGQEGGAVWFRDPEHAKLARQLRSLGFTDAHDFRHVPRGHNYRMSNAHAELILESLSRYDDNLKRRRELETAYDDLCPTEWRMPTRDAPWVYDLRIPDMTATLQDRLVSTLNESGIAARNAFKPMHVQEEYRVCRCVGGENAERLSREVVYLPLTPGIPKTDCVRAFDIIRRVVDNA